MEIPDNFIILKTNIEKYLDKYALKWKCYCVHIAAIFNKDFNMKMNSNEISGIDYVRFFTEISK